MDKISKEVIKKNRKTALIIGFSGIIVLQIILLVIMKTIHGYQNQLVTLGISIFVVVTLLFAYGKYRKRKSGF